MEGVNLNIKKKLVQNEKYVFEDSRFPAEAIESKTIKRKQKKKRNENLLDFTNIFF